MMLEDWLGFVMLVVIPSMVLLIHIEVKSKKKCALVLEGDE